MRHTFLYVLLSNSIHSQQCVRKKRDACWLLVPFVYLSRITAICRICVQYLQLFRQQASRQTAASDKDMGRTQHTARRTTARTMQDEVPGPDMRDQQ